ncbi:MAG: hypothetical protein WEC00_04825 [Dongiaceae bacterium]
MPALNPDHLLDQAHRLTAAAGGIGAPRQADLRRAISTAYYALFHAILTEAADDFVGKTQRHMPRYTLLYRSIDHKTLRVVCEDVAKPMMPAKYATFQPAGGFSLDIKAFATALFDLQEKRHTADYDPRFRVRTSDTVLAVATGRNALVRLRRATVAQRRAFVSLLVFPPRWG